MLKLDDSSKELAGKALAAAISAVFAGSNVAYAQETDDSNGDQSEGPMEEVIVTATKRAESIQDVPMSITAFTDETIVQQGFKRLGDYAGQIPGLAFAVREPGGSTVLMRGCVTSGIAFSDSTTTSVYLDEQPITAGGFNPDPRLIDIERVEALSGPQATLLGDSSMCGSLRIITNKPDLSGFSSWGNIDFHTVDDGDDGNEISGMVNIPLIEDKLALRLVGWTGEDAGYIDNVFGLSGGGTFDNAAMVSDDVNTSDFDGGRLGLRWAVDDNWTLDATYMYQNLDVDGFGDVDLNQQAYAGRNFGSTDQLRFGPDTWKDDWYQFALTLEGNTRFGDLLVTASYFDRDVAYHADAATYQFFFNVLTDVYYPNYKLYDFGGDPSDAFGVDKVSTDRTTFEARLSTPADSAGRWHGLVGVFYNSVDEDEQFYDGNADFDGSDAFLYLYYLENFYNGTYAAPTDNWFAATYESDLDQWAVFGEATFDVTDNFSITAGGRYFDVDTDRVLKQTSLVPPPTGSKLDCAVSYCVTDDKGSSDENDFIPKVSASYHFSDQKMVYGTYSEGFRRGGANAARPNSIFGSGMPLENFDSDKIKNYEIGAKTTWLDGTFRFNITAYHMVWDDVQIEGNDPNPGIFAVGITNAGEAEINGGEAFLDWVPLEGLEFTATIGYNDAELSEDTTLAPGITFTKGTQLPLVPDWKGSVHSEYNFQSQLWNSDPWVSLDYQYTGNATNSITGLQSIVFSNPPRLMGSYNKWNLRAGLGNDKWSAAFYVDNMFDEDAITFYNDRWAQQRGTILQPRTYGVSFRMHFD